MEYGRRHDDKGVGRLARLWPIFVAIIAAAVGVGAYDQRVRALEKFDEHAAAIHDRNTREIVRLGEVATSIPEMRRDIKEILRRVK